MESVEHLNWKIEFQKSKKSKKSEKSEESKKVEKVIPFICQPTIRVIGFAM